MTTGRRLLTSIDLAVIHCSDTPNGRDAVVYRGAVIPYSAVTIDEWHRCRGFERRGPLGVSPNLKFIGYNYVIHIDGEIVACRSLTEVPAHVRGHNASSIGVCLIGRDQFTAPQWLALRSVVTVIEQSTFGNDLRIVGHRDLNDNKACPGFDVSAWHRAATGLPCSDLICDPLLYPG